MACLGEHCHWLLGGSTSDGTSNTFLIGERDSLYGRGAAWIGTRNPRGALARGIYYVTANVRPPLNSNDPPFGWNGSANRGVQAGFSSLHTGGANFSLPMARCISFQRISSGGKTSSTATVECTT